MNLPEPDGVTAYSQEINTRKSSFTKAFLMLAVECNDLDNHLDFVKKIIADLELKQKNLDSARDESYKELNSAQESLKLRSDELECEKEKFLNYRQKQMEEFLKKEEKLGEIWRGIEKRLEEVEISEKKLARQKKSIEGLFEKIEMEKQEFLEVQKNVANKLNAATVLEKKSFEYLERAKEFDSIEEQHKVIQKLNEERGTELDIKAQGLDAVKESIEKRNEELDSREEQLKVIQKLNEKRGTELDIKAQGLDAAKKAIEKRSEELHLKAKKTNIELDSREKQLKVGENLNKKRSKELDIQVQGLDAAKKLIDKRSADLHLKAKEIRSVARKKLVCTSPSQTNPLCLKITHKSSSPEASPSSRMTNQSQDEKRERRKRKRGRAADHPASSSNPFPVPYLSSPVLVLSDNDGSN